MNEGEAAIKEVRAVRLNLSLILCNEKDYTGAIEQATHVLDKNPDDVKALYRRSTAYFKKKFLDEAKTDLKRAYNLDKNNKAIKNLLKKLNTELKK